VEEERIAVFVDYENLAIGANQDLGVDFQFKPVADALAERGRVVVRRAYADWTSFEKDRMMLTLNQVELIEIPQRRGTVRKNAADIKMAVDAVELAFERGYVTAFAICTGDSDFTPLVHKLRELNRTVIGIGLRASTSALLPAACDEFLFYENLAGVDAPERRPAPDEVQPTADGNAETVIVPTLNGLSRAGGPVRASSIKRALLRKDPTFTEGDYGFRGFLELLHHLEEKGVVVLDDDGAVGDPIVTFPEQGRGEDAAFDLLRDVVLELAKGGDPVPLSGLKDEMRKRETDFSEKPFGYSGFLQFVKAADARGFVDSKWSDAAGGYVLTAS
jgi:uncharacterized protein (TIGR00288 family)